MKGPNIKLLSAQEVATHSNSGDCWLIIEGQVWNLTEFAPKHPGGAKGELLAFDYISVYGHG